MIIDRKDPIDFDREYREEDERKEKEENHNKVNGEVEDHKEEDREYPESSYEPSETIYEYENVSSQIYTVKRISVNENGILYTLGAHGSLPRRRQPKIYRFADQFYLYRTVDEQVRDKLEEGTLNASHLREFFAEGRCEVSSQKPDCSCQAGTEECVCFETGRSATLMVVGCTGVIAPSPDFPRSAGYRDDDISEAEQIAREIGAPFGHYGRDGLRIEADDRRYGHSQDGRSHRHNGGGSYGDMAYSSYGPRRSSHRSHGPNDHGSRTGGVFRHSIGHAVGRIGHAFMSPGPSRPGW